MAPVGSYESLAAAIQGGAGSVYFGIEGLNMRSRSARSFTIDDLHEIARICRKHRIKSYLTVNTIIYDSDLPQMRTLIDAAREANLSAIIAADVAAMVYARSIGVEVHLSTQLNISNIEALKFYAQFADVVVLARELNLEQVREIYEQIEKQQVRGPSGKPVQIEMFAHGALCMAVSGKCYLSLHEMNASANRGACNQVCRHGYTVKDREGDIELAIENQYIMSPKDLKTIHFIHKMMDAGVRVFKIEGRARGPEYVRTVCECYNEAIRAVCENRLTEEKIAAWDERLKTVFNRGFWNGYYLGQRLGEWSHQYGNQATEKKLYVGKVIKYFPKLKVAECLMETQSLQTGDKILITGPTTGALFSNVEEIRVDLKPVPETVRGESFSMPVPEKVRPSDKLYKLISNEKNL
ncbi:MAG: U32 family peptidase [Dysgonamonadaceae bacterium]|jgi:putative protease|nr:U32 family peptidase [Dysgonamonadaceae bacterium]